MTPFHSDDHSRLYNGDCLEVLKQCPDNYFSSIVTDPPYGLEFMGKDWDKGVPGVEFWKEFLRVTKPGGMALVFGGTRTFHRLACAIEDAGWEIRDCIMWLYGSGFPKSLNISKSIDKAKGAEREIVGIHPNSASSLGNGINMAGGKAQKIVSLSAPASDLAKLWNGWGTALKPAWEPIIVAMKPTEGTFAENAEKWGVAGINVDGARIAINGETVPINKLEEWSGFGQKERPAYTQETNTKGRFPANLLLDEEAGKMLDEQSEGKMHSAGHSRESNRHGDYKGIFAMQGAGGHRMGDSGGASRFFYCAKAGKKERGEGNKHPTVKPLSLMRYLVKLIKPPVGGKILDPFAGSGTTLLAAHEEGVEAVGIEMQSEYCGIIVKRLTGGK